MNTRSTITAMFKDLLLVSLLIAPISITSAQGTASSNHKPSFATAGANLAAPGVASVAVNNTQPLEGAAGGPAAWSEDQFEVFDVQQLGQRLPLQARLQNQRDQTVTLQKVLNGQPAVVIFTDYSCGETCSEQLMQVEALLDGVAKDARSLLSFLSPAQQYRRIAISINTENTPAQAFAMQQYLVRGETWHLLSSPSASIIAQLSSQAGLFNPFIEAFPATNLPTDQLVLLSAEGVVTGTLKTEHLTERELEQAMLKAQDAALGFPLNQWLQSATASLAKVSRLESIQVPSGAALAPTLLILGWLWFRFGRHSRAR